MTNAKAEEYRHQKVSEYHLGYNIKELVDEFRSIGNNLVKPYLKQEAILFVLRERGEFILAQELEKTTRPSVEG